jgi:hypothetical protein
MTNAIAVVHESGFGISFGGSGGKSNFSDSSIVNVPLSLNGEQACFKKKNSFVIKTEESQESNLGNLVIIPMEAEFENIPNPSIKQYLFADKSSDKVQTKFYMMSFVCSGEIPLSIDASSDSYLEVSVKSAEAKVSVSTFIATGLDADNLKGKIENPKSREAFNFFADKYKIDSSQTTDMVCCNQKIPSIITSTSIDSLTGIERAIATSFTTMGSKIPNGCSNDFTKKMENFLIENYEKNESLTPFKISKKWFKKDLVFEWKNR